MVPFESKFYFDDKGNYVKGIFIDEKLFDWKVEEESFDYAFSQGPKYFQDFQKEVEKHFLESVSDFMGRKVTTEEINEAVKTGVIQK